jgi:hypothetical protein
MAGEPTTDFLAAQTFLQQKFNNHSALDVLSRTLDELQPKTGWSLINELIQNAIDIEATNISFSYSNSGNLKFQHNAKIEKYPLDSSSIQGLCGVAESTKGLSTVGFMGVGFKFFIKFFNSVTVSDRNTCFKINYPVGTGWKPKLESLYSPKWVELGEEPDEGFTTSFYFEGLIDEMANKIENVFKTIKADNFAIFAKQGLSAATFENNKDEENQIVTSIQTKIIDRNGVQIRIDDQTKNFLVLQEEMMASNEVKELVIDNRKLDLEDGQNNDLIRTVSLVLEYEGNGDKIIIKKRKSGTLFCLVPLTDITFPFKIGLDADWFMPLDRAKLKEDSPALRWHKEMIHPTLPKLLKKYFNLLGPNYTHEERKKATDIFPNKSLAITDEYRFISDDEFHRKLTSSLNECKFVLCTDGELRVPSEVKNIEDIPGGETTYRHQVTDKLGREIYDNFIACVKTPIVDRSAISTNTINYLTKKLEMLPYPELSDFDTEKIKKLWNPNNPSQYLHILDMFVSMMNKEEGMGPEIVPLNDGTWGRLLYPDFSFDHLPIKDGVESKLYETLQEHPGFEEAKEVHDALKFGIKKSTQYYSNWDASGNKWKETTTPSGGKLWRDSGDWRTNITEIEEQDEELLTSILHFAIRTNDPKVVNYLLTRGGISKSKKCFIPTPYANALIIPNESERILEDSMRNILATTSENFDVKKFLLKAGLIVMKPKKITTYSGDSGKILEKTGITVSHNGAHKSSYATKNKKRKNEWTIIDHKWPVELINVDLKELSKYLSKPTDELKSSMTSANKFTSISYYFIDTKSVRGTKDSNWINQLKTTPWVECSDGEYRIPSRAPLSDSENLTGYHAILEEHIVEFYQKLGLKFESSLEDLSSQECMEHWQHQQVQRPRFFMEKLMALEVPDEDKKQMVLNTIWPTAGDVFKNTKLKNFVNHSAESLGGYIGKTEILDKELIEKLEKIGLRFEDTIAQETVFDCASVLVEKIKDKNSKYSNILQKCWRMLLEMETTIEHIPTLNSELEVITQKKEKFYISPFICDERFDLGKYSLYPGQFPAKLSLLRILCDRSEQIEIVDNLIEVEFDPNELFESPELSRIAHSMRVDYKFFHCNENHTTLFEEKNHEFPLIMKLTDEQTQVFVWKDRDWVDNLVQLLLTQGGWNMEGYKILRDALKNHDTIAFESLYKKLCDYFNLDKISDGDIRKMIIYSESELEKAKEGKMKKSQPARLMIAGQKEVSKAIEKAPPSKPKSDEKKVESSSSPSVRMIERNSQQTKNNSTFTDVQIGDRGEELVRNMLKEKNWSVEIMPKNNPGYDIIAKKDGRTRYIEVKSNGREWETVKMKHQQGLHYYKTVEEDDGVGLIEYWICIVENILNESKTAISGDPPTIWSINLTKEKPDYIFSKSWKNRIRPDDDFLS